MNRPRLFLFAFSLALTGCAEFSISGRIQENAALFSHLAPRDQATIRGGHIALGYTPTMVYLALGAPQRKFNYPLSPGRDECWLYARWVSTPANEAEVPLAEGDTAQGAVSSANLQPGASGPTGAAAAPGISEKATNPGGEQFVTRISFQGGRVVSIEQD